MFKKELFKNKIDALEKRSHNAPLGIVPTSILTGQLLARLLSQRVKKFKFSWRSRETYQLR
ncbi:MAG: hypothetical protein A3B68_02415 [Candidatus Melainabacteria bacterium RIFCSPHIGHO2_02_FULL_34_12]|nr:MAG: hypothetical protein A3B68_02415 [Candidatus Melainabacteria bacterium RIFCSPHIGHO2_02_FULL_34_12]